MIRLRLGDDRLNAIGVSFNPKDGLGEMPIPRSCDDCCSMWTRQDRDAGARYLVDGDWLCSPCMQKRKAGD